MVNRLAMRPVCLFDQLTGLVPPRLKAVFLTIDNMYLAGLSTVVVPGRQHTIRYPILQLKLGISLPILEPGDLRSMLQTVQVRSCQLFRTTVIPKGAFRDWLVIDVYGFFGRSTIVMPPEPTSLPLAMRRLALRHQLTIIVPGTVRAVAQVRNVSILKLLLAVLVPPGHSAVEHAINEICLFT